MIPSEPGGPQRPVFTGQLQSEEHTIQAAPDEQVRVPFGCMDPEGLETRIYRWYDDPGVYDPVAGELTLDVPAQDPRPTYHMHLICSDGTGGYASARVSVEVTM